MILITLLILIVGIVVLIQIRKNRQNGQVPEKPVIMPVTLPEILPVEEPVAEPAVQEAEARPEEPEESAESAAQEDPQTAAAAADDAGQTSPEAKELIDQAIEARKAGKIIASRDLLNDALKFPLSEAVREEVKSQLSKLSERWLFSHEVQADDTLTELCRVKPGDLLAKIGDSYKVPYQILQEINGISRPETLQAGQTIKVINGPFHAVVSKSTYTMDLYLQDKYVKSYRVGIGESGRRETPTGLWRVRPGDKLIKPTWTDPDTGRTYVADDPDYPLGSRWIGLEGLEGAAKGRTGFAIHGTKDPETIGTRSSKGCIRLYNGDVIEAYNLLFTGQSLVRVVE